MRKELFVVLVSIGLLIAAFIAACQEKGVPEPLLTTPGYSPGSPGPTQTLIPPGTQKPTVMPATPPSPAAPASPSATAGTFLSPGAASPVAATPGSTSTYGPPPTFQAIMSFEDWRKMAFKYISDKYKAPLEELSVGDFREQAFPVSNVIIAVGKVTWFKGGARGWIVAIDKNGNIFEEDGVAALREAERAATVAKYGKLEPRLYDLLQTKGSEDKVEVIINVRGGRSFTEVWVETVKRYPQAHLNPLVPNVPGRDTPQDFFEKVIQPDFQKEWRANVQRATTPLVQYLTAQGYTTNPSILGSTVVAVLPKKVILELQQRDDVGVIGYELLRPGLDTASPTDAAPTNWERGRKVTGDGVFIGVLEPRGGTVNFNNPYLRGLVVGNVSRSTHPTWVAESAASNRPTCFIYFLPPVVFLTWIP